MVPYLLRSSCGSAITPLLLHFSGVGGGNGGGGGQGLIAIARHVTGCHSTQETRVHNAVDDAAGGICEALPALAATVAASEPTRCFSSAAV